MYLCMVFFSLFFFLSDVIVLCLIAGCPAVEEFDGTHLVFIGAGSDPYEVITNAVK